MSNRCQREHALPGRLASLLPLVLSGLLVAACSRGPEVPAASGFFIDPDDQQLVAMGEPIYFEHCASCHGAALEGDPDWRRRRPDGRLPAPPHDASGHTWHHPDWELFATTAQGVTPLAPPDYETDMPAYRGVLTDQEIIAVLAWIKAQWPAEIAAIQQQINVRSEPPPGLVRR